MKKVIYLLILLVSVISFCACGQNTKTEITTTEPTKAEETTNNDIYKDSEYVGTWYNADSADEKLVYELRADGTAIYEGSYKGKWTENENDITINIKKGKEKITMTGYFVIAGDGFVARATEQNQHFLDDGEGELQLEIMLTENTCVDCVKKDTKK